MNFSISPYQAELIKNVQAFCERHLSGVEWDKEVWEESANHGLLAMGLPNELGGMNESFIDMTLLLETLGNSRNSGMVFSMCAQLSACSFAILKYGSQEQKQKWLPKLGSGESIAAHAMTESYSGSNSFKMVSEAVRIDEGYVLNGEKVFITNAPVADVFVCFAATNKSKGFFGGISCFLIPKDTPGLAVSPPQEKMGLVGSLMGTVSMSDVIVPENALIGKEGAGSHIFNHSILIERVLMGAFHLGATKRILEETLTFVKQRTVGGDAIKNHQAVSHKLADIKMSLESLRWYVYKLAVDLDNGHAKMEEAASVKTLTSDLWVKSASDALQIHGASGYMAESHAQIWVRDSLASRLYSGSNEVLRNLIARTLILDK